MTQRAASWALAALFLCFAADAAASPKTDVRDLTSVVNFRDVGGHPSNAGTCVRRGLVFRSGHFVHTTAADARALGERFNLRNYYDLRSQGEINVLGAPTALVSNGVRWHSLAIDSKDDVFFTLARPTHAQWSDFYVRTVRRHAPEFVRLLNALAYEHLPAVYGCSFGKDRTGVATALLLGVLGVSHDTIVDNYAASTENLVPLADKSARFGNTQDLSTADFAFFHLTAHKQNMRGFIDAMVAEHGSLAKAAMAYGVSRQTIGQLRRRYLSNNAADCTHTAALPSR